MEPLEHKHARISQKLGETAMELAASRDREARLTAENAALTARAEAAEADAARLREALLAAADTCDRWANESRTGGWSTHQVTPNRDLANDLRRAALATPAQHASDCAMHSAPAAPAGPCDCGATPAQEGRS